VGLWRRAHTGRRLKLHIIARGKMGRGPEADLIARYAKRITWPLQISELPEVGGKISSNARMPLSDRRGGRPHSRGTRISDPIILVWPCDLAPHARPRDAGRTTLARGEYNRRASLSPGGVRQEQRSVTQPECAPSDGLLRLQTD
jgi:hypothetical protein